MEKLRFLWMASRTYDKAKQAGRIHYAGIRIRRIQDESMSADRASEYGKAAQAVIDGKLSTENQRAILCFLIGHLEGNDEFREALTREVNFYLNQDGARS